MAQLLPVAPIVRKSLYSYLAEVPDRRQYNIVHPLPAILALTICAILCGARSNYAVSQWGRDHGETMARLLGFRRSRTPCHASIHNVFTGLDVAAFEAAVAAWVGQYLSANDMKSYAVDGKKLRGIHGEEIPGVFLIAAFSQRLGLPVAQVGAADKEGELAGAKELIEKLDLNRVILVGDALYCQRGMCERIVEKKGTTSSSSKRTSARCWQT
jgi:hypothetical protein